MAVIKISDHGSHAYVMLDDEDLHLVEGYTWWVQNGDGDNKYAMANVRDDNGKIIPLAMHRVIMGVEDSNVFVDHKNHNGLDNRKVNLRLCTHAENMRNKPKFQKGEYTSIYKGVYWRERDSKWRATIYLNGKNVVIGNFESEVNCAIAYDVFARKYYGEFAYLNFPDIVEDESFIERTKFKKRKSKYNGVYSRKNGKFVAIVTIDKKSKHIGTFSDEIECAKAYDKYLIENNIQLEKLNFKNRGM